jgi:hypothetical protein
MVFIDELVWFIEWSVVSGLKGSKGSMVFIDELVWFIEWSVVSGLKGFMAFIDELVLNDFNDLN